MAKDIHAEVLSRQSEAKPERDVQEPKVYRQTAFEARRLQELTEEGGWLQKRRPRNEPRTSRVKCLATWGRTSKGD